jgi:hypothetical protein
VSENNGRRQIGVLELILLVRKRPELVVEPCHSLGCRLRIPECREHDGLGHMLGNASLAMCYLKQRAVEIVPNGLGPL